MKRFADLTSSRQREDCLVPDNRADLTPADMVDRRVVLLLTGTPLAATPLRPGRSTRSRSRGQSLAGARGPTGGRVLSSRSLTREVDSAAPATDDPIQKTVCSS
jgi:hypothetical protein